MRNVLKHSLNIMRNLSGHYKMAIDALQTQFWLVAKFWIKIVIISVHVPIVTLRAIMALMSLRNPT